jgi:hypothetical protein
MARVKATKIKVGDCVGLPAERRTQWITVDRIKRPLRGITRFESRDLRSPSMIKYGVTHGSYIARDTEAYPVSPNKCKKG